MRAKWRPKSTSTDDFEYLNELAAQVPEHAELPGVAGFKIKPPQPPDRWDEVAAFVGASYFRALGQGSAYGLSARGLALNTGTSTARGISPVFKLLPPPRPCRRVRDHDLRHARRPLRHWCLPHRDPPRRRDRDGRDRPPLLPADVTELGVAPLTSMFLFSEKNRAEFDDYRPNVHDSDGLRIVRADGDVIWRPLNNPRNWPRPTFPKPHRAPSACTARPRLRQLPGHRRPLRTPSLSRRDSPGRLGTGRRPPRRNPLRPRSQRQHRRLLGPAQPVVPATRASLPTDLSGATCRWTRWTRSPTFSRRALGAGGFAGVEAEPNTRKFVVDFKGGQLGLLPRTPTSNPWLRSPMQNFWA